jgi:glutaredoxin-like protein NrdH
MAQNIEITLYSGEHCQRCKMTARKLEKHGLTFTEIDTSNDEAAAQFLRDAGYQEIPVVQTSDGREWTGFRPDIIEAIAREEGLLE